MSTVIKVENLSKQYRLGSVGLGSLSHDINRWWQTSVRGKENPYLKIGEENNREIKGTTEYVWALREQGFPTGFNFDALRKWMESSVAQRSKTLFERSRTSRRGADTQEKVKSESQRIMLPKRRQAREVEVT